MEIQTLLDEANAKLDTLDHTEALDLAERALKLDTTNATALELCAALCVELGEIERAKICFCKLKELQPDNAASYLSLGQFYSGKQAVPFFERGVEILSKQLAEASEDSQADIKFRLSSALCSLAEIYMTDCCFEVDAEERCENYIRQAYSVDPLNPEVHQTLASLRMSQLRPQDAKDSLVHSLALWMPSEDAEMDEADMQPMPSYRVRISAVKLLLELKEFNLAARLLFLLQQEDDTVLEMWFLFAMCYWCLAGELILIAHQAEAGPLNTEDDELLQSVIEQYVKSIMNGHTAPTHDIFEQWVAANECLEEAWKVYTKHGCDDESMLEQIQDLAATVKLVLKNLPAAHGDVDGDDSKDIADVSWESEYSDFEDNVGA